MSIPEKVIEVLRVRGPYSLLWGSPEVHEGFNGLTGPAREIAQRLIDALSGFPPNSRFYELLAPALANSTGYTVSVATIHGIRITVRARYNEGPRTVIVRELQVGKQLREPKGPSADAKKGE